MLYSPRYPVNLTLQGAAAKLSYFFHVLFVKYFSPRFLLFDFHISKLY